MTPKISIVLPTYNGARWLSLAIESIQHQSLTDWELIIVNDGSTDQTEEIIDKYAKIDARIQKINNPINKKIPGSLNIGFKSARGKYFTWTSDDNLYKTDALETMASFLDSHPDIDLFSGNIDIINEEGQFVRPCYTVEGAKNRKPQDLIIGCNIGGAFLYRREIAEKVGGYDEKTFCAEDYDYWCRIAIAGNIHYSEKSIYEYRVHAGALTQTQSDRQQRIAKSIQSKYITQFVEKFKISPKDQAILARRFHYSWKGVNPHARLIYFLITMQEKAQKLLINLTFFWNKKLRHKLVEKTKLMPSWHFEGS